MSSDPPLPGGDGLPDILQFMQLLWILVHRLDQTSKRMTTDIGVTGPQRLTLRVIGLFPGLSAGRLAHVLHLHPSTMTGILQRLVAQHLVARVEDPTDRRRAVLRLTPLGARVNGLRRGTVEAAVARALAQTSPRDRAAAQRVLLSLAAQLESDRTAQVRRRTPRQGEIRVSSHVRPSAH